MTDAPFLNYDRGEQDADSHYQVTREGTTPGADCVSAEEKAQLINGVSQLLLDVLHKPLESTFVVIEEVPTENWGWGGLPALEYRKLKASKQA
ncbi:4-oxalocrotonate tautomerase family protein [Paraburkholderia sp. Tr-20389]|nr:4-oxalocrotonate tautomerase family protein [Paraburkholderia sp. Tr-20389]